MRKSSLLKLVVVIGLSLVLALSLVSVVKADDNTDFSGWSDPDPVTSNTDNTANAANTANTADTVNTTNTDDTMNSFSTNEYNSTISTGNATTTINSSTSENETEVNNLAYTGIGDNSILVVVILVGAIVAGYSLRKIKEYNI